MTRSRTCATCCLTKSEEALVHGGRHATDVTNAGAINGSWDLPFGKDRTFFHGISSRADRFVGGWSLSGIVSVQSGFPFSPQLGYNPTGNGECWPIATSIRFIIPTTGVRRRFASTT